MASVLDNIFGLFEFEAQQAYDAYAHFYQRREEGFSLSLLRQHTGHVGRLYQGLSADIALFQGAKRVTQGCHFINQPQNISDNFEGYRLQAVIGTYGMKKLNSTLDKREKEGRAVNGGIVFYSSSDQTQQLELPPLSLEGRSYRQLKTDVEKMVCEGRFDLMKQALDDVRERYPPKN